MSEGTAVAPAAATPATASTNTPPAAVTEAKAPAKVESTSWSDDEKKQFFELAKKSPYKAKIKGEERGIDSDESLRDLLNHAQRGVGASKLAEERNKLEAQAKEHQSKAERYEQLLDLARRGDFNARKELGLVDPREIKARESEWDTVPPEVRELYDDRSAQQKRADAAEAKLKAIETERNQKREQAELRATQSVAMNETHKVLSALNLDDRSAQRYLPLVAGAIADLQDQGLELGVDMTTEMIVDGVKALAGSLDEQHFENLSPKKAITVASAHLAKMPDGELMESLSPELVTRIARLKARSITQQRMQPQAPVVRAADAPDERKNASPPKVLQPWRWK